MSYAELHLMYQTINNLGVPGDNAFSKSYKTTSTVLRNIESQALGDRKPQEQSPNCLESIGERS